MHAASKENEKLMIKKSRNGKGIFTRRNFQAEERLFEVTGGFITYNEDEEIDKETRSNTYRYSKDLFINPKEEIGDYLNHSCNPNSKVAKIGKRLFIISIKSILKNREVVIDYSTIIAADDSWKMECNCGSRICRKKIGKFKSLPSELRGKYIKTNIVPAYILDI
jgi:SET domain-containing protein